MEYDLDQINPNHNNSDVDPVKVEPGVAKDDVGVALFTRHNLTLDQHKEIEEKTGESISAVADWTRLAEASYDTISNIHEVWDDLIDRITSEAGEDGLAIFGVFPAPIRAEMHRHDLGPPATPVNRDDIRLVLYESWNTREHEPGRERPRFNHRRWVQTRTMYLPA